ncbi:MAG: GAF domain-containing protein [Bacteroidales bacterium]|nr:MAG: GAF domain-containing protein [Bacteroidales bacterium]
MKIKLKIWQKIIIFILGAILVVFSTIFIFISHSSKDIIYKNALEYTNALAKQNAYQIESWLNYDLAIAKTLSNAFLEYKSLPQEKWLVHYRDMYNRVFAANPHLDALWDSWELSNLDPQWDKPTGRQFYIIYKEKGVLKTKREIRSLTGDPVTYGGMKKGANERLEEPYISLLQGGKMMTSVASPLLENGKFIGLVALDLVLSRFQELVNSIKPFPESYAFLLSNKGVFVSHPDTSLFKKNINNKLPELVKEYKLLEKVQRGEEFNFSYKQKNGETLYYTLAPIIVGKTNTPWALGIVVPKNKIMAEANSNYNINLLAGIIGLLFLIIVLFVFTNYLTRPINEMTKLLQEVATGRIDKSINLDIKTGDEIEVMANALSASIVGINNKTDFARQIGSGNLDVNLNLLSEDDVLGKSLIDMRDNLLKARDEEVIRKQEEEKVKWANEGLTLFAELLRQNNNNRLKLGDEIIKNIVWYLNAIQGGLFVINDKLDREEYELIAAFAFDRKRIIKKSFAKGEGLVGTCAAEKDIINLIEIPQEYIEITSGLGGANPNALLLVPLIVEEEVLGVIELTSFNRFKTHEIEFVKKVAQNIASTLHSVNVNSRTAELLEKSQEQAEMMAAQEEEMRQNMEELQSTQEEASRKTSELEGLVNALNTSAYLMEYDTKGYVLSVNDSYQAILGIPRDKIIGTHHSRDLKLNDNQIASYEQFWHDLRKGNTKKQTTKFTINGMDYQFLETYSPIYNQHGEVSKILKIAVDISNA